MMRIPWITTVLVVGLCSPVGLCGQQRAVVEREVPYRLAAQGFIWPSEPPADIPFERSKEIVGILFTGVHSDYRLADTWYPSWASDGNLYSPWTDGVTDGMHSSSAGPNATTGQAVLIGDDPLRLRIKALGVCWADPRPYGGRYPCGSLVYNGVWYYGTYCLGPSGTVMHDGVRWNWPVLGPTVGFRISTDYGRSWIQTPHSPAEPLFPEPARFMGPVKIGAPHFVDFGRNMEHSPDGKAYLVGHGAVEEDPKKRYANLSWISGDQIYLVRVKPSIENINDASKYEYFAGHDAAGRPMWTKDFRHIRPLLEWNNNMGCVTVTYNAPLRKYLMCVTDGWPTCGKMNSYILEADVLTGPWRLVCYMKEFGEQGYFLNFPSKFISADGWTAWLCYSANFARNWRDVKIRANPPGSRYGLVLQQVKLLNPRTYERYRKQANSRANDPLASPRNVASRAKVCVSSSYPGYEQQAVVDGIVGGYPDEPSAEWASHGEREGAMVRLMWDEPVTVDRVWLFDRPNVHADQVTGGLLVFSDGTTIEVGALPDDGKAAKEIRFAPKRIRWMLFVVTKVKPETLNVGLAEIGVFETQD